MKIINKSLKHQSGFTLIGWIIVAFIGGFFAYLSMLLFPVVISNYTMGTILNSLDQVPGINQMTNREIKSLVYKRLVINDVRDVTTDNFEIVKENKNNMIVYLDYENKIEFAKDIYILIVNNKEVEISKN